MNGIHDMGGMAGFGPVLAEPNEPVFHTDWERRTLALGVTIMGYLGPVDRFRHERERIDPVTYLTASYYEQWLMCFERVMVSLGWATQEELRAGKAATRKELPFPAPSADDCAAMLRAGFPANRDEGRLKPAYSVGDEVRARNIENPGHTRLPLYVRGKPGRIMALHGSHVFPDTAAHDLGENAQPLYSVRFEAAVLWGDNVTRRDAVYIDLWEDYLEPLAQGSKQA